MTFICCVCHEGLTTHPDEPGTETEDDAAGGDGGEQQVEIVATNCGHLYHVICLHRWFNSRENLLKDCPYCHTRIVANGIQEIFLAGGPNQGPEHGLGARGQEEEERKLDLLEAHDQLRDILIERQGAYEEETAAHDLLKVEHAEKSSEVDQLREKLKTERAGNSLLSADIEALKELQMELGAQSATLTAGLTNTQTTLNLSRKDVEDSKASNLVLTKLIGRLEEEVKHYTVLPGPSKPPQPPNTFAEPQRAKYEALKRCLDNAQTIVSQLGFKKEAEPVNINNNTITPVKMKEEPMSRDLDRSPSFMAMIPRAAPCLPPRSPDLTVLFESHPKA